MSVFSPYVPQRNAHTLMTYQPHPNGTLRPQTVDTPQNLIYKQNLSVKQLERLSSLINRTYHLTPSLPTDCANPPLPFTLTELKNCIRETCSRVSTVSFSSYFVRQAAEHILNGSNYGIVELFFSFSNMNKMEDIKEALLHPLYNALCNLIAAKCAEIGLKFENPEGLKELIQSSYLPKEKAENTPNFESERIREIRHRAERDTVIGYSIDLGCLRINFLFLKMNNTSWRHECFPFDHWYINVDAKNCEFLTQSHVDFQGQIIKLQNRRFLSGDFQNGLNPFFYFLRKISQGFEPEPNSKKEIFTEAIMELQQRNLPHLLSNIFKDFDRHFSEYYPAIKPPMLVRNVKLETVERPSPVEVLTTLNSIPILRDLGEKLSIIEEYTTPVAFKLTRQLMNKFSQNDELVFKDLRAIDSISDKRKLKLCSLLSKTLAKREAPSKENVSSKPKVVLLSNVKNAPTHIVNTIPDHAPNEIGKMVECLNAFSILMSINETKLKTDYSRAFAAAFLFSKKIKNPDTYFRQIASADFDKVSRPHQLVKLSKLIVTYPELTPEFIAIVRGLFLYAWIKNVKGIQCYTSDFRENQNTVRWHFEWKHANGTDYFYIDNADPLKICQEFMTSWRKVDEFLKSKKLENVDVPPSDPNKRKTFHQVYQEYVDKILHTNLNDYDFFLSLPKEIGLLNTDLSTAARHAFIEEFLNTVFKEPMRSACTLLNTVVNFKGISSIFQQEPLPEKLVTSIKFIQWQIDLQRLIHPHDPNTPVKNLIQLTLDCYSSYDLSERLPQAIVACLAYLSPIGTGLGNSTKASITLEAINFLIRYKLSNQSNLKEIKLAQAILQVINTSKFYKEEGKEEIAISILKGYEKLGFYYDNPDSATAIGEFITYLILWSKKSDTLQKEINTILNRIEKNTQDASKNLLLLNQENQNFFITTLKRTFFAAVSLKQEDKIKLLFGCIVDTINCLVNTQQNYYILKAGVHALNLIANVQCDYIQGSNDLISLAKKLINIKRIKTDDPKISEQGFDLGLKIIFVIADSKKNISKHDDIVSLLLDGMFKAFQKSKTNNDSAWRVFHGFAKVLSSIANDTRFEGINELLTLCPDSVTFQQNNNLIFSKFSQFLFRLNPSICAKLFLHIQENHRKLSLENETFAWDLVRKLSSSKIPADLKIAFQVWQVLTQKSSGNSPQARSTKLSIDSINLLSSMSASQMELNGEVKIFSEYIVENLKKFENELEVQNGDVIENLQNALQNLFSVNPKQGNELRQHIKDTLKNENLYLLIFKKFINVNDKSPLEFLEATLENDETIEDLNKVTSSIEIVLKENRETAYKTAVQAFQRTLNNPDFVWNITTCGIALNLLTNIPNEFKQSISFTRIFVGFLKKLGEKEFFTSVDKGHLKDCYTEIFTLDNEDIQLIFLEELSSSNKPETVLEITKELFEASDIKSIDLLSNWLLKDDKVNYELSYKLIEQFLLRPHPKQIPFLQKLLETGFLKNEDIPLEIRVKVFKDITTHFAAFLKTKLSSANANYLNILINQWTLLEEILQTNPSAKEQEEQALAIKKNMILIFVKENSVKSLEKISTMIVSKDFTPFDPNFLTTILGSLGITKTTPETNLEAIFNIILQLVNYNKDNDPVLGIILNYIQTQFNANKQLLLDLVAKAILYFGTVVNIPTLSTNVLLQLSNLILSSAESYSSLGKIDGLKELAAYISQTNNQSLAKSLEPKLAEIKDSFQKKLLAVLQNNSSETRQRMEYLDKYILLIAILEPDSLKKILEKSIEKTIDSKFSHNFEFLLNLLNIVDGHELFSNPQEYLEVELKIINVLFSRDNQESYNLAILRCTEIGKKIDYQQKVDPHQEKSQFIQYGQTLAHLNHCLFTYCIKYSSLDIYADFIKIVENLLNKQMSADNFPYLLAFFQIVRLQLTNQLETSVVIPKTRSKSPQLTFIKKIKECVEKLDKLFKASVGENGVHHANAVKEFDSVSELLEKMLKPIELKVITQEPKKAAPPPKRFIPSKQQKMNDLNDLFSRLELNMNPIACLTARKSKTGKQANNLWTVISKKVKRDDWDNGVVIEFDKTAAELYEFMKTKFDFTHYHLAGGGNDGGTVFCLIRKESVKNFTTNKAFTYLTVDTSKITSQKKLTSTEIEKMLHEKGVCLKEFLGGLT